MYSYQLENTITDKTFLEGQPVSGRAVLKAQDVLTPGTIIVVVLSTGAKYKGMVKSIDAINLGGYTVGDLEIVRQGVPG